MSGKAVDVTEENWKAEFYASPLFQSTFTRFYPHSDFFSIAHEDLGTFDYSIITHNNLLQSGFSYHDSSQIETDHDEELLEKYVEIIHGGSDIELWNKETFVFNGASVSDKKIKLSVSDFYSALSISTKLILEIFNAFEEVIANKSQDLITEETVIDVTSSPEFFLPLREKSFSSISEILANASKHNRPIGGTYLTALKDSTGKINILVGSRSDNLTSWPSRRTIFPAGYMQPDTLKPFSKGLSFQHMADEFSREVFNVAEDVPASSNVRTEGIDQLLRSGDAVFENTGFGFSADVLNAECSGLLYIDDPEYTDYLLNNIEQNYEHTGVSAIPIEMLYDKSVFEDIFHPYNITPTSAFAFYNGLKELEKHTDSSSVTNLLDKLEYKNYD